MNIEVKAKYFAATPPPLNPLPSCVALHCSGADGGQWNNLTARLEDRFFAIAPDLIGANRIQSVFSENAFSLAKEAASIIEFMDRLGAPSHLIGHSYGGALALHISRVRRDLVRSICIYEPTLFSVLRTGCAIDQSYCLEIVDLTERIRSAVDAGFYEYAAQVFTDFWSGEGAWQSLTQGRRDAMTKWIWKAPLDFDALLTEPVAEAIIDPKIPTTIIVGAKTHPHTRRIAELLSIQSGQVQLKFLEDAGHLGPFTHRDQFGNEVLTHLHRHTQ